MPRLAYVLVLGFAMACTAEDAAEVDVDLYVEPGTVQCDNPEETPPAPDVVSVIAEVERPEWEPRRETALPQDPTLDEAPAYLLTPDGRSILVGAH